jgi:hypothetical protein
MAGNPELPIINCQLHSLNIQITLTPAPFFPHVGIRNSGIENGVAVSDSGTRPSSYEQDRDGVGNLFATESSTIQYVIGSGS